MLKAAQVRVGTIATKKKMGCGHTPHAVKKLTMVVGETIVVLEMTVAGSAGAENNALVNSSHSQV